MGVSWVSTSVLRTASKTHEAPECVSQRGDTGAAFLAAGAHGSDGCQEKGAPRGHVPPRHTHRPAALIAGQLREHVAALLND